MKKITENALLYRVNQLREKMSFYEAVGDGSQTPVGGLPNQTPNRQTPGNPGYNVKPYQQPATPPAGNTTTPPAGNTTTPPAGNTITPPAAPEGHWYDPAVNFAKGVGDDLSYAADHAAELGQGVGQTAANMAKSVGNAVDAAGNFIGGAVKGATGGTQGQQKINSKQPHTNAPHTGGQYNPQIAALQQQLKAKGANLGTSGPKGDGVDGIMGPLTKAAQAKFSGATPAAPSAPVAGQVMPNGSVSSGDAERDERLAQANQVMNMTPAQRHQFDMAAGQKDYAAAHPAAPAANKAPVAGQMQSTGDPAKDAELAKQGNAVVYKEDQDLARIVQLVNW